MPPFRLRLIQNPLPCAEAEQLARSLPDGLPWYQARLRLYGRWHWSPRLQSWIGDPGLGYRYSGLLMEPEPWPACLETVRETVNDLAGERFNSVLCNWYRHGQDSMGWHSDNERELGPEPLIGSLTLGASRRFHFRRSGEKRLCASIDLPHNSLLVMPRGLQAHYQHQLPKTKRQLGDRFNLTFRRVFRT